MPPNQGALVLGLASNSPAARAGIEGGDIVVDFNGKPVESVEDLQLNIPKAAPGSRVKLKIRRSGRDQEVTAVVSEMPQATGKLETAER